MSASKCAYIVHVHTKLTDNYTNDALCRTNFKHNKQFIHITYRHWRFCSDIRYKKVCKTWASSKPPRAKALRLLHKTFRKIKDFGIELQAPFAHMLLLRSNAFDVLSLPFCPKSRKAIRKTERTATSSCERWSSVNFSTRNFLCYKKAAGMIDWLLDWLYQIFFPIHLFSINRTICCTSSLLLNIIRQGSDHSGCVPHSARTGSG